MATLSTTHPTLIDHAKRLDPNGKVDGIVEILNETNEILDDMVWFEGNLPTGHRSTVRTGIPEPTWRGLYQGVQPSKTETAQVTDNTGNMENYSQVDKDLADLNGNTKAFMLSESRGILEGFSQELADSVFYANEATEPQAFTGFAPRFNSLSAENAENIIDCGGTGSDNCSIWLVVWGPDKNFGIYPKASKAGITMTDKGQETVTLPDGSMYEAYRIHFKQQAGLVCKDWRYVVRACNIDKSLLGKDATASGYTGADLVDIMTQMLEIPPNLNGRAAFYVPKTVRSFLRRQIRNSKNVNLSMMEVAGKKVVAFDEVPVRRCDSLSANEARVV